MRIYLFKKTKKLQYRIIFNVLLKVKNIFELV